MFPDPPSDRHVLFCETCSGGVREISNRTDTDIKWETKQNKTKQNKTKQNRGANVQSIVNANVECDSLRLLLCGEKYCAHSQVAQLGKRERKEEHQQSKKKGNNWMLPFSCKRKYTFFLGRRSV